MFLSEKTVVTTISANELLEDYIVKHGEKGKLVLEAAVRAMRELENKNDFTKLGDFDYKTLKEILIQLGGGVNPTSYLRILERDYGLIIQTYRSTRQQWWSFVDKDLILRWYEEENGRLFDDPHLKALLAKYYVLKPQMLLNKLEKLSMKTSLSLVEQQEITEFVFSNLDKVVSVLNEMKKHGDIFRTEINVLTKIIDLTFKLTSKIQ